MLIIVLEWLVARIIEPCSWAGLGVMMHSVDRMLDTGNFLDYGSWSEAVTGAVAFILPEKKKGI